MKKLNYDYINNILKVTETISWRELIVKQLNISLKAQLGINLTSNELDLKDQILSLFFTNLTVPISDEGLATVMMPYLLTAELEPDIFQNDKLGDEKLELLLQAIDDNLFVLSEKRADNITVSISFRDVRNRWQNTLEEKAYLVYKDLYVDNNQLQNLALIKLEVDYSL